MICASLKVRLLAVRQAVANANRFVIGRINNWSFKKRHAANLIQINLKLESESVREDWGIFLLVSILEILILDTIFLRPTLGYRVRLSIEPKALPAAQAYSLL